MDCTQDCNQGRACLCATARAARDSGAASLLGHQQQPRRTTVESAFYWTAVGLGVGMSVGYVFSGAFALLLR